jgi:DNA-binding transcriptional LysR family regulator
VRLLLRNTRSVALTADGNRLYKQASATLHDLRLLCQDFNATAEARRNQVEVAATMMVATIALPPIVKAFTDRDPQSTVRLLDSSPAGAISAVREGRCDMAIMVLAEPTSGLQFETLTSDECVVVTPRNHPLLARHQPTLAEVLAYPLLSPDTHVALRQFIVDEATKRGLNVRLAPEALGVSNVMTMLAMAAAGIGVCIHPRTLIPADFLPAIGVVPLKDCQFVRTFGIVTAENHELSPAARKFRDFLRSAIKRPDTGWQSALV